jgi:hypothetical protein
MDFDQWLQRIIAFGLIIGGVGYGVGQWVSQKGRGHSDALEVALREIEALRVRSERQDQEMKNMHQELAMLRAENESFRSVLTGGTFLAEQIRTLIADEVEKGARTVVAALKTNA